MPKDYLTMPFSEFVTWIKNLNENLPGAMATKYGVGAPELAQLVLDKEFVEYWAPAKDNVEQQGQTVNGFVENAVNGALGGPTGTNPDVGLPAGTPAPVAPGIKKRIRQIVNGIKSQKSIYLTEDGEFLGFETGSTSPDPASVKPTGKVFPALLGGFEAAVVVEGRGEADQIVIEARPVGSTGGWTVLATITKKSANVTWPGAGSAPVQLEFRIRLMKGDANYGQPSDTVIATLNP